MIKSYLELLNQNVLNKSLRDRINLINNNNTTTNYNSKHNKSIDNKKEINISLSNINFQ